MVVRPSATCTVRTAAISWEKEYAKSLVEVGCMVGKPTVCAFFHSYREIHIVVYGDDFAATGNPKELEFVRRVFCDKYPDKVRRIVVQGPDDANTGTILNRVVWEDGEVSFEADPKHVEKMLKDMRLPDSKPI